MMKKGYVMGLLIAGTLLTGCEFESYDDHGIPPYDGAFTWTEVTGKADWSQRLDHAAVSFDGKLWVLGGFSPTQLRGDSYQEDVWSSEDGLEWTLVTDSAPWLGRRGHTAVVFDDGSGDAMYIIGGFVVNEESGYREYRNDVWRSRDGIDWEEIRPADHPDLNAPDSWYPRFKHASVVATHGGTDYIYLVGGYSQVEDAYATYASRYFNDVWRTTDGISWEKLDANDFGIRAEHALTVDPENGRLYMQGGRHGVIFGDSTASDRPHPEFLWLWHSDDGVNWQSENGFLGGNEGPLNRTDHQLVVWDGELFCLPGRKSSNNHFVFDGTSYYTTWRRHGDNDWSVDSQGSDFGNRLGYSTVTHLGRVWLLGGESTTNGPSNDVWSGIIE